MMRMKEKCCVRAHLKNLNIRLKHRGEAKKIR